MDLEKLSWYFEKFEDLNNLKLYEILKLRTDVFVVEQKCAYPELDGSDKIAIHQYASYEGQVVACSRIFFPGDYYDEEAAIGRIVVHKDFRGIGLGHTLMEKALSFISTEFGHVDVKIAAQSYLKKFYEEHGFRIISEEYIWDGIPHFDLKCNVE